MRLRLRQVLGHPGKSLGPVAVMQVLHIEEVVPDHEPQCETEFARRQFAIRGDDVG